MWKQKLLGLFSFRRKATQAKESSVKIKDGVIFLEAQAKVTKDTACSETRRQKEREMRRKKKEWEEKRARWWKEQRDMLRARNHGNSVTSSTPGGDVCSATVQSCAASCPRDSRDQIPPEWDTDVTLSPNATYSVDDSRSLDV